MSGRERRLYAPALSGPDQPRQLASTDGNAAYNAAANNAFVTQNTLGPAATVSGVISFTPMVSGKIFVTAGISAVDATLSDPVTATLSIGAASKVQNVLSDATAGNATATIAEIFSGLAVGTPVNVTMALNSPGGHNLTTTAQKIQMAIFELPA